MKKRRANLAKMIRGIFNVPLPEAAQLAKAMAKLKGVSQQGSVSFESLGFRFEPHSSGLGGFYVKTKLTSTNGYLHDEDFVVSTADIDKLVRYAFEGCDRDRTCQCRKVVN